MKTGLRRMYAGLHKTGRKRSGRFMGLTTVDHSKEISGWRNCTTIKPMEDDHGKVHAALLP